MSDLICRQAAIEVIDSFNVFESRCDQIKLEQMIGELPSAQPEPKRGWWIEIINSRGVVVALRCSRCEKSPRHGVRSDYCPNCGAEMEVTT